MKKNLENVKKVILIADNSPVSAGISQEIDAHLPWEEDWEHLGDDYFWKADIGVCGPSGGDPTRTFVPFGDMEENIPHCPVCQGNLKGNGSAGEDCLCFFEAVKEHFGL